MTPENERAVANALAFTLIEGIRAGGFDRHLPGLLRAVHDRQQWISHTSRDQPPKRTASMIRNGQVWAWMNRPDGGRWEVRGTGLADPADATMCRALNPDDPEIRCAFKAGHDRVNSGVSNPDWTADHGDPERGAWWDE